VSTETVYCLLPEMILAAVATFIFIAGAVMGGRGIWSFVAAGGLLVAMFALYRQYTGLHWPQADAAEPLLSIRVGGPLAIDLLGQYVRWLVLIVGLLFVLITASSSAHVQAPEYVGSLLVAILGLMLVGTANELVLLFVSLELISIPTYVLLYLGRRDMASQEAATKYFFLSILSSALMLYGFSFLYGATGSTQLTAVRTALEGTSATSGALVFARLALVFIVAGLGFKLAAVPFHFYAPDVYQGTTNGNGHFGGPAKDRGHRRVGADRRRGHARSRNLRLAASADRRVVDHDLGQRAGALARQCAAPLGVFVDRSRRVHADRPGRGLCVGRFGRY